MSPPFAHLGAVTAFSLRDGTCAPHELAAAVAERGMDRVGVCDRDGLYGAVRLAQACAEVGVTPIFGVDLPLAVEARRPGWDERRAGRPAAGPAWLDAEPARVRLLARTQCGYAHLVRAVSAAHHDSPRGTPRLRWDRLLHHLGEAGGGLLALLGDDAPPVRLLDGGRPGAARAEARRWLEPAGRQAVLVGVTHHRAPGDDDRARARFALADELGLRAVADQRPRYLDAGDARLADLMDAIRGQVPLASRHSRRRNAEGFLKTPAQMAAVFRERPDALANAAEVAAGCDVDLGLGRLRVPDFAGTGDSDAELRRRSEAGCHDRFGDLGARERDRLDDELAMIARLGLAPYFLTVADIVERIRDKQILVACRGSAAGSLVAYCLRISDVDPLRHDLCYERFMNPYRDELPDIDLDVESARRLDVYRDLLATYGTERVACVTMVETFKARMAIREVGKALGLPAGEVDAIAKSFPHLRARDVRAALANLPELADAGLDRPDTRMLFDLVERLDGLPRHVALHPSGVLLGPSELGDLVPCERSAEGFSMAQFDKDDVEALGLCKLDVLGVRMLSAMSHGLEEARRVRGVELAADDIPVDDDATYELIRSTRTLGMFQIESPGQRELLGKLQPETIGDLVVDISLFRPGPVKSDMVTPYLRRRHGVEPATVAHPVLADALAETHGVIVYHEQVMRCVAAITGCDLSTADLVRRRLSDEGALDELGEWIVASACQRGMSAEAAETLWGELAQFASFGFCKAHAAAFGVPTARSAWMKAHLAPEFVAGLLTHDPGMYPRRLLLADARQFGVCVLPADVNVSDGPYRVERVPAEVALARLGVSSAGAFVPDLGADPDEDAWRFGIRLGLQDVAGIDEATIDRLRLERPFDSIADLHERARPPAPVAEALAQVGALDPLVPPGQSRRDALLEVTERWSGDRPADTRRRGEQPLQPALLPPEPPPGLPEYRLSEQVRTELEILGLDASAHVMSFYDGLLDAAGVTRAADLLAASGVGPTRGGEQRPGRRVRVAGAKVATQTPPVRSGQRVIFLSLDDGTDVSDSVFFESTHAACARTVFHSWLLLVEGRVHRAGAKGVSLVADRAWDLLALMDAWRQGRLQAALEDAAIEPFRADPAGPDGPDGPARRLWHASGGSAGR